MVRQQYVQVILNTPSAKFCHRPIVCSAGMRKAVVVPRFVDEQYDQPKNSAEILGDVRGDRFLVCIFMIPAGLQQKLKSCLRGGGFRGWKIASSRKSILIPRRNCRVQKHRSSREGVCVNRPNKPIAT